MRVYFIVHGNAKTGLGHIVRSLSLATAFEQQGHEVIFFSKYEQGIQALQKTGIKVYKIPYEQYSENSKGFFYGDPKELKQDIAVIRSKIQEKADALIVDTYNVSAEFFLELKSLTKCLVYIDDLNLFSYPVDILVNGTASAFDMEYEKGQSAQLLLGLEYNQVRKEFCHLRAIHRRSSIKDILVTTGSADPYHMTEKILGILMEQKDFFEFRYHVVVGGGFEKDIWSNSSITNRKNIFLYDKPKNISGIMARCDIAVTAGGSTLYELAACGVPAIVFAYADNQLLHIKALERYGIVKYVGYYQELDRRKLIEEFKYLMAHMNVTNEIAERAQSLVDGNGCGRIVEEIEQRVLQNE